MIQLIPNEIELAGLAERMRALKAALREAVKVRNQAEKDFRLAELNCRELRQQFGAARGDLVQAAGGSDEDGLSW